MIAALVADRGPMWYLVKPIWTSFQRSNYSLTGKRQGCRVTPRPTNLWPQHPDFVNLGKPEGMVGPHHDPKRLTARSGNGIGEKAVCCDVQTRNRVFRQHRHPYFAPRGHDQAVEASCPRTAEWGLVG